MIFFTHIIEKYLSKFTENTSEKQQAQVCNYQDNYYGDQLCTFVKK